MTRRLRLGVDTGGTFTDVVAVDEATGEVAGTKTPSTPDDPADGFLAAVHKVLAQLGAGPSDVVGLWHGTTVATNQLLEGRVGRLALITTEGFEALLEIARQSVPDGYGNSYFWVKPDRIVPADLVRTVPGRLDHTGAELRPIDAGAAAAVARELRERGVSAVGVCLLHGYLNPAHERLVAQALAAEHPGAAVSLSSQVLPEYREYERAMTTLVDAAVKPRVTGYLATVRRRLAEFPGVPFAVMKSNGGVRSAAEVVHQPITTVLSGPAAGALGAAMVARAAGVDRVLTLDGGGTSTDVSVVRDGEPVLTTEGRIGPYPTKIPMIDIVTVGAGGGSIAYRSRDGLLKVGPRSAGADPGPICYRRGGTEPTVTDAHLVLGRIPAHLLGGEVPLDPAAARTGLAALAAELDLPIPRLAEGILEISAWHQANALRQITVERGLDVREFTLATFGGSGSLLACRLLDLLGLAAALVPRDPGNLSALGLLSVDVRDDHVATLVRRHAVLDTSTVDRRYAELTDRAGTALAADGFPPDRRRFARSADLRYYGQAFEVRVPVADAPFDATVADAAVAAFHAEHRRLYGYSLADRPDQQVEWVNLRVTGIGPLPRPALPKLARGDGDPVRAVTGRRVVRFAGVHTGAAIYRRDLLLAGDVLAGPAVVEEYGSTVPVEPGFRATVDDLGNLVVTRG